MKLRTCLMALCLVLPAGLTQAGWVMQQQTPGGQSTIYMQDNMMRAGGGEKGVIYNLKQGTVTVLDPGRKIYWTGRPQELRERMDQQMHQALDQRMEQALQNMPPEQREQMRAMMAQRMGRGMGRGRGDGSGRRQPQVEVKQTNDTQTIAGYKARKYQVTVNGRPRQEMWMASAPGFSDELDMSKMMELVHSMRMGGPGPSPGFSWRTSPAMLELMKKGMPMMIVDYGPAGPAPVMKVIKVENKDLPASLFTPPAGFKQVDFNQMMR